MPQSSSRWDTRVSGMASVQFGVYIEGSRGQMASCCHVMEALPRSKAGYPYRCTGATRTPAKDTPRRQNARVNAQRAGVAGREVELAVVDGFLDRRERPAALVL